MPPRCRIKIVCTKRCKCSKFTVLGKLASETTGNTLHRLCLRGAADAPRPLDDNWKPDGLLAKLDAGADFFQTQYCFDMDVLRAYMARLGDEGITERAFFLIGIGPIASVRSARYMNENLLRVQEEIDLNKEEIAQLVRNAFEASWLTDDKRSTYLSQVSTFLETN